jgi:hypothetical protein
MFPFNFIRWVEMLSSTVCLAGICISFCGSEKLRSGQFDAKQHTASIFHAGDFAMTLSQPDWNVRTYFCKRMISSIHMRKKFGCAQ